MGETPRETAQEAGHTHVAEFLDGHEHRVLFHEVADETLLGKESRLVTSESLPGLAPGVCLCVCHALCLSVCLSVCLVCLSVRLSCREYVRVYV